MKNIALVAVILLVSFPSYAWQAKPLLTTEQSGATTYQANESIQKIIAELSKQQTKAKYSIELPTATGDLINYTLFPAQTMPENLQQKYPTIKSFKGYQTSAPEQLARIDLGPNGFYAMYLINDEAWYLDPTPEGYYKLYQNQAGERHDEILTELAPASHQTLARGALSAQPGIITYKIAVAATGEYAQFYKSITNALNGIVTTINRVNLLFERDLAIQLQLVDNNDLLIYTDAATDPFANNNPDADITASQQTIDNIIGANNYDIGHVFATDGGGLAQVGSVCRNGVKGQGMTGTPRPQGDSFNVDFVAHEIGHQLGALHTFNGTAGFCEGGRIENSAYELGGGVTVMGYAGICSDGDGNENIRNTSIATFHFQSINEIHNYVRFSGGRNCGEHQTTNNMAPVANAGNNFTIPQSTPFMLAGQASDANNDQLIYTWEQFDLGTATTDKSEWGTKTNGPLFRNYPASDTAIRYLPNLQDLMFSRATTAEILPTISRRLTFKFVARDQRGGVGHDDITITVSGSTGPFTVVNPKGNESYTGRQDIEVAWQVNGTDNYCPQVNISMNADLNDTFEHMLLANTTNDGSAVVALPNITSPQVKLMVACSSGGFFNLNQGFFSITESSVPLITGQNDFSVNPDEIFTITLDDLIIESNKAESLTVQILAGEGYTTNNEQIERTDENLASLKINLLVSDGVEQSEPFEFLVNVNATQEPALIDNSNSNADVTINVKGGSSGTFNLYLLLGLVLISFVKSKLLQFDR